MLPGIFGIAFDFGYGGLLALLGWCVIVMCCGFYVLRKYRSKEEWEAGLILEGRLF